MGRSTALSKVANAVSLEQPGLGPDDAPASLGRNLTYGLLDNLGRAIVTGQFDDEAFPTEAELTKRHGVSRSVTREAVKMLTAKGLLSARPRQRSAERRVGKEGVSTGRTWWAPYHSKKKKTTK